MNKELILKYKPEFDHWLHGGKILMHYGKWIPVTLDAKWEFFMTDLERIGSLGYIIDDEYVEFRKALAEGKQIECNVRGCVRFPNDNTPKEIWEDLLYRLEDFSPDALRIKSEEQHIKIGDYLYDIQFNKYHRIENVLDEKVETKSFRIYKSSINDYDYRLWKPEVGELVVMYTEDYSTGFTVTLWEENSKFIPIPFTGELPE